MNTIEPYSYHLGVIDAFNEMIAAELKPLALSHGCNSKEERDALIPEMRRLCGQYGTLYYIEDELLTTDLFPKSATTNVYLILLYNRQETILSYLALKERKECLQDEGNYSGDPRKDIAVGFGQLLGYPMEKIDSLIASNGEKE